MDNLDGFQKLVSTRWTFSISISIGLERQDPQAYNRDFWLLITFFKPFFRSHKKHSFNFSISEMH